MRQPSRLEVSAEAGRGLARLPTKVSLAIVEFITGPLAEDPYRLSKPLRGDLSDHRSARRGDYRVIIRILEADMTMLVFRIDHRANAYRPR